MPATLACQGAGPVSARPGSRLRSSHTESRTERLYVLASGGAATGITRIGDRMPAKKDLAINPRTSWVAVRRRLNARGGVIAERMKDDGAAALLACIKSGVDTVVAVNALRFAALMRVDRDGDTLTRGQAKGFFSAHRVALRTYEDYKEKPREYF